MTLKPLFAAAALALAAAPSFLAEVHAQAAPAPAAAPAAPSRPAAAPSAAKKALVAKILQHQQGGIEAFARQLIEQPAAQMLQAAAPALQRLPAERREAVFQDIRADARKFVEDNLPPVRDRAVKLAPSTIGSLLEERFNEDELKQILAFFESPVQKRFQQAAVEMQRSLSEKLVAEMMPTIEPRLRSLQQSMAGRLGIPSAASAAASAASR